MSELSELAEKISKRLTGGFKLIDERKSKSSHYFYIDTPDGYHTLKARLSDHGAMTVNSRSHVRVIWEATILYFDFEFEMWDADGWEIDEITEKDAALQLSEYLKLSIPENRIYEIEDYGGMAKIQTKQMDRLKVYDIIAAYIAEKIKEVDPGNPNELS